MSKAKKLCLLISLLLFLLIVTGCPKRVTTIPQGTLVEQKDQITREAGRPLIPAPAPVDQAAIDAAAKAERERKAALEKAEQERKAALEKAEQERKAALEKAAAEQLASQQLKEEPVKTKTADKEKKITLADINFDYDKSTLRPEAREILQQHAQWLRQQKNYTLVIEGHCDERGTPEYNLALGERRAAEAMKYLIALGIPEKNIATVSYGEELPLDPRSTEEAWAKNRRAHFIVTFR